MDVSKIFSNMGIPLTGRSALDKYGNCSRDDDFIWGINNNLEEGGCGPFIFCTDKYLTELVEVNGVICADFNKALYDLLCFEYDESATDECFDFMTKKEKENFWEWCRVNNVFDEIMEHRTARDAYNGVSHWIEID